MSQAWVLTLLIAAATSGAKVRTGLASFEMTLNASAAQLEQSEVHERRGDVVLWLPGAHLPMERLAVDEGPVAQVLVRPGSRGTAITLAPRDGADLRSKLAVLSKPSGLVRIGPPLVAAPAAPPPSAPLPATGAAAPLPASAFADLTRDTPQPRVLLPMLALAILGAVAWGWRLLRRQSGLPRHNSGIRVLAMHSLGGAQRLCLVEVAGERLLLAANDKEVTLLSHLAPSESAEAAASAVATPPAAVLSDVQGILKLRPERPFKVVQ